MKKTTNLLYVYAVICLITISICFGIINRESYAVKVNTDIVMRDSIYEFLEVFSLSNRSAIYSLKDIASDGVINKFSSLSGDTETRVPMLAIWTYDKLSDKKVEVVFDSKLENFNTLYRYTFEFDLNSYKIQSVKTEFLYRGVTNEED